MVSCKEKLYCELCGKYITKINFTKHQRRHDLHPESFIDNSVPSHEGLNCIYCNKLCKNTNSLKNHERLCKYNPNRFYLAGYCKNKSAWNKGLNKNNNESVRKQSESFKKYCETHSGLRLGTTQSEETKNKISYSMKKFLVNNPDMIPYKRNHSSKESYPEKYFNEIFKLEGLDLVYHVQVGLYQLDFCNEPKKIDVEIDGEQHYVDDRIVEHDKLRNANLEKEGWHIIRIRWAEYVKLSKEEKEEVINSIKQLLY